MRDYFSLVAALLAIFVSYWLYRKGENAYNSTREKIADVIDSVSGTATEALDTISSGAKYTSGTLLDTPKATYEVAKSAYNAVRTGSISYVPSAVKHYAENKNEFLSSYRYHFKKLYPTAYGWLFGK
jgi:hypothetical protein